MGIQPRCDVSFINCRCPDKDSYEYLCYQCYLTQKDISDEDYKLKFNANTGKVIIFHDFKKEILCDKEEGKKHQIINITENNAQDEIKKGIKWDEKYSESGIELVALSLTQAYFRKIKVIPYTNFVYAFKTDQFVDYFWNLSINVMQNMQSGKDCKSLLIEMYKCIDDINTIYINRERIGKHFSNYLRSICKGLEKIKYKLINREKFLFQQNELIVKKNDAKKLEEFLFYCVDTDGKLVEYEFKNEFIRLCFIIKEYIVNYQKQKNTIEPKIYDNLISVLNLFDTEGLDISTIKGLEKLNLEITKAWRANAGVICRYLQSIRKINMITAYDFSA